MLRSVTPKGERIRDSSASGILLAKKFNALALGANQAWYSMEDAVLSNAKCSSGWNGGRVHYSVLQYGQRWKGMEGWQSEVQNIIFETVLTSSNLKVCHAIVKLTESCSLNWWCCQKRGSLTNADACNTIDHSSIPQLTVTRMLWKGGCQSEKAWQQRYVKDA